MSRYRCRFCGLAHRAVNCPDPRWRANGEYGGRLKVIVLPPGVCGLSIDKDMDGWARTSGHRGRLKPRA